MHCKRSARRCCKQDFRASTGQQRSFSSGWKSRAKHGSLAVQQTATVPSIYERFFAGEENAADADGRIRE
ncbi:hypothetical protein B7463_g8562, partial [Scytalidium lignicola]